MMTRKHARCLAMLSADSKLSQLQAPGCVRKRRTQHHFAGRAHSRIMDASQAEAALKYKVSLALNATRSFSGI